jgi:hypothetical protein
MPFVKRQIEDGYIVVHHLYGDREAIEFLRGTTRELLERLCNTAKREGEASFSVKNKDYIILRNPDATYAVFPADERPSGVAYLNR